jgi:hypothetical protein
MLHPVANASSQSQGSPRLVPLDSAIVQDAPGVFVGRVTGFAVSPAGRYYLTDAGNLTIFEVDRSGRILRSFGRRGQGPGELSRPSHLAIRGDDILLALDGARVVAFDLRSGAPAWQRSLPRITDGIGVIGQAIVVTGLNVPQRSSLLIFRGPDDHREGGVRISAWAQVTADP